MAIRTVQESSLTSIANAIRTKGGTSAQLEFPTDFVSAIQNIPTGGGSSATPKDVNFYDYDGTLVDSYTASEFAALSAMPDNPSHDGLTAQGWNWSLTNAKTYVAKYGKLNIGQMYVTTSGDTEIDIQLGIGRNNPYLACAPYGTVDIDWGDGSAHDTLTGTSASDLQFIQHTYPDTGEMFTIKLHMESGVLWLNGNNSGSLLLCGGTTTAAQKSYMNAIKAVRLSEYARINEYAFYMCYSLTSITIPESSTYLGTYAFANCYSLKSITIPTGVSSLRGSAFIECYTLATISLPKTAASSALKTFNYCRSLTSITIPENLSIGNQCFSNCSALTSVTIPDAVLSIGSSAFQSCSALKSLKFTRNTPPTAGSGAFSNLPSDLVVYVPAGTLADYQAASNYSDISSKMVEMSA